MLARDFVVTALRTIAYAGLLIPVFLYCRAKQTAAVEGMSAARMS